MRILYLADIRFPLERANGIQTLQTCHALAERGHSVTLGVRPDVRRPARDPFAFYGTPPSDRLVILRAIVRGPAWAKRLSYLAFALTHARRRTHDVVFTRDLTVASVVLRLPGRIRPPVVYESHGFAPVFADTMHELLTGAAPGSRRKSRRLLARERRVWHKADGYVTTTAVLARELTERFGPRQQLATVPNGARTAPARPFKFPEPGTAPIVAYSGHLYPWKGVDVLMQALTGLPGVHGLIVGGHPQERDLQRVQTLARDLGIEDRVIFTGPAEVARVLSFLESAHVLVLPTTATPSARYTSPLKLFEYMAAGRPIVASDLPSVREIVQDGVSACLVAPGDPQALAAGIRRVLEDRPLAERIASAALAEAPAYSWERRANHIERLLDEVVRGTTRPDGNTVVG